ncbi:MAG: MurR/RpiR family transcriptional regulator [Bacilli bacterium]
MINQQYYSLLTEKEKHYVCQIEYFSNEIPLLSIYDLSSRIYTSPASLSRLVKKLGYSSYKEFKQSFIPNQDYIQTDNCFTSHIQLLFTQYQTIINDRVIPKLYSASRIFVVAFGPSTAIAQELGCTFNILNIDYLIIHDSTFITQLKSLITGDDLVIYISYSGKDPFMEQIAIEFKHKYYQLLFTSTLNCPLSTHVTRVINTRTDSLYMPYNSRLPLHTLINSINLTLLNIN